jgi:hypothetical protein
LEADNGYASVEPMQKTYDANSLLSITAEPDKGYAFYQWESENIDERFWYSNPLKINIAKDLKIKPEFRELLTVQLLDAENGMIESSPSKLYLKGVTTTFIPKPNDGFYFNQWIGFDIENPNINPLVLNMEKSTSIGAEFLKYLKIEINQNNGNIESTVDLKKLKRGDVVELKFVPSEGYKFIKWTGISNLNLESQNPLRIEVLEDISIGVEAKKTPITVHKNGKTLIAAPYTKVGEKYEFNGVIYTIASRELLDQAIANKEDLRFFITTKVENLSNLFEAADWFNQNIQSWDVSNVSDMSGMFNGATTFNQTLKYWDVSNVTSMANMFREARKFNQDISTWNMSKISDLTAMFYNASSFNQEIGSWKFTTLYNTVEMFYGATSFNRPLENWDMSKVVVMNSMFENAKAFNQALNNWDVTYVEDYRNMFKSAVNFNKNISSWKVNKAKDMNSMFENALKFDQDLSSWCVPLISSKPQNFSKSSLIENNSQKQPKWGGCSN